MDTGQKQEADQGTKGRSGSVEGNSSGKNGKNDKTHRGGARGRGEGMRWRNAADAGARGRGEGMRGRNAADAGVRGRGEGMRGRNAADADRWGRRNATGGGGRGGHRGQDVGRNQKFGELGAAERGGAPRTMAAAGARRGGHSGHSSGSDRGPKRHKLGFKALEDLCQEDPSLVAITLSSHPDLKTVLTETKMRQNLTELLCRVLSRALQSRADRVTRQHLANIIKDSGFFQTALSLYLVGMGSESNPVRRAQYPEQLDNILVIVTEVLSIFPASSVQAVSMLVTLFEASVNSLRALGVNIQPTTDKKVEGLRDLIGHLQERSREGTLRSDKDSYALLPAGDDAEEQHEDFRTIPIYPTPEEFHKEERPFLRQNLTSQRYSSAHVYLDTHFRLLREDFVRPLREGIQQLIRDQMEMGSNSNPLKKKRFDDIRVYFNTQLVAPTCTHSGIAYIVKFDVQPLKFVRWQNTKRLIYGSLVCLSCDNFESFLFATVSDRNPKDLQEGKVQIIFTEESRIKLASIQEQQVFLMVESSAYFEAYRYVLEGLQEQVEADLPFQRYIVECSSEMHPPAYLRENDLYDLKAIVDRRYKGSIPPFSSLWPEAWPEMEKLALDESQMKALQLALTKELAIIQGPPGTGKTYVGLKVAQALLTNQELWNGKTMRNGKAPMLIVCYTNHALDQFLEGIHKFLKTGIVRVGGQSNSEVLKRFNLRELANSPDFRHHRPSQLRNAHNDVYDELRDAETELQRRSIQLECSLKGVLRETILQQFISFRHWKSLHLPPTPDGFMTMRERKPNLMEWLGLSSIVVQQREPENVFQGFPPGAAAAAAAAAMGMELDNAGLIEIQEEADLIQAERMIIDDWSFGHKTKDDKKKALEEAARKLEKQMLAMDLEDADIQAGQSEDGFEMQRDQKRKMNQKIKKELQKSTAMSEEEEDNVLNVWTLSLQDRWRLYRLWVMRYRLELRLKAQEFEVKYQDAADRLADVKRHEDLCVLRTATVIGMTTTGAAKYRKVLQQVRPRVVIVEEAAEVLEAHTITTLSKACQHLILIGDHQQLRPSATVYELGKNFSLEMSMFERLVKMGVPFVRLNYQHRMRPEIARLLTPHIYAELANHHSVFRYEHIKGVKTNLFFVEHNHPEEQINDGKSHQNRHEAKFIVALCRYFLLQDYKPEQITILTTYTGQFNRLRELMPAKEFSGVRVHVVDKYQGEENDIVLLSLVRSNLEGKVGFLNIANRVCVALSRAKKGLYCIGNSENLSQVKLWGNIFHTLRETHKIGKALTLCCQNHPERLVKASCAEDFKEAPEGGCTEPCQFRLDCGHVCSRVCHPYDPEHKLYQCAKPCQKFLCELQHRCPLVCHKECPEKCQVKVQRIIPKCQHTQMVPCHQDLDTFNCTEPCQKLLTCGHPCTALCGEACSFKCRVKVTLELNCGHIQQDACFYKTQQTGPECKTPCEHQLKCGHACKGTCGKCHQGRFHSPCSHPCERLLICSHKCLEPCTRDCPPCSRPCENCCIHSKCMKRCGERCTPCVEPCPWQCPHHRCNRLCHEPCDRPPCTEPCDKTLPCGHPCIGLCGDICPNKCRICNHDEVTEIFFGTEDEPDAYFIQLEDCGHIFEYTAMDKYMNLDSDSDQAAAGEQVAIKLKECPRCRTPIRKNLRYGSSINRSLAEIEMVKEKINGPQTNVNTQRMLLRMRWQTNCIDLTEHFKVDYQIIQKDLENFNLTRNDLWVLENKMEFLIRVVKLSKATKQKSSLNGSWFGDSVSKFVCWLKDPHQKFTDQQVSDLQKELQRLSLLAQLHARCCRAEETRQTDKIASDVQKIIEVLEKPGQLTELDEHRVKEAIKELNKKVPLSGLGIDEEERKMIVSAMKMAPGHWHKCPNGHVYVITECGGAMERRKCPDCDATIGGASHRLDRGNAVATEMDGAQHSAWSEMNNVQNFDQNDFL